MSEEIKGGQNTAAPDYYEDEISLVDLVGVLFRRKWLIIAGPLLLGILAAGYAFMQPEAYMASSMIEIGQLYNSGGEGYRKIESSNAIKNRLSSLGQAVGLQLQQKLDEEESPGEKLGFSVKQDFNISIPEQGTIVQLELEAPRSSHALDFFNGVERGLIEQHKRIFDQEKTSVQNMIQGLLIKNRNIDTEIKELKNQIAEIERKYESKIGEKQNTISRLTNTIENLKAEKESVRGRIQLLEEEKKDLRGRIDSVQERYTQFLNSKVQANNQADEPAAIGLMLFNSELQQMRKYRDHLRDRLLFQIPKQISQLSASLKKLNSDISNHREELKLEKKKLSQLEPEMKDRIAEVQGRIQEKKNQQEENELAIEGTRVELDNMIATRVLQEPVYSRNPVTPNVKMFLALGVVLGFFLSVFGAFLVEFWENNKDSLKNRA